MRVLFMKFYRRYGKMFRTVYIYGILPLVAAAILLSGQTMAEMPSHLDRGKNIMGCSACHSAHGKRGGGTLRDAVPQLCYNCHSPSRQVMTTASTEVYADFQKKFTHPVEETARNHVAVEVLPEEDFSKPRHVSCLDCHNHHISEKQTPLKSVKGYSRSGTPKQRAESIDEVCYKCHSDSVNRPLESPNVREQFDPMNESYHPVVRRTIRQSISIIDTMRGQTIECTDCHDPHGSDVEDMLRYNYTRNGGPESNFSYELCYGCHKRDSILGDQSFAYHKKHIIYESISCSACHSAHGSRENRSLISFDSLLVSPNSSGFLNYSKMGKDSNCYLSCHGIDHVGVTINNINNANNVKNKKKRR